MDVTFSSKGDPSRENGWEQYESFGPSPLIECARNAALFARLQSAAAGGPHAYWHISNRLAGIEVPFQLKGYVACF